MVARSIYSLNGSTSYRDKELIRSEGQAPTAVPEVDSAYDYIGIALNFFRDVFAIDTENTFQGKVDCYVNYGRHLNSAEWNYRGMFLGDGDNISLRGYAFALDVIAHEMMHGVVDAIARLRRSGDSGSISEHLSDIFGVMTKQWSNRTDVNSSTWIVGDAIVITHSASHRVGIRRLDAPGRAHAEDTQVAHMDKYSKLGTREQNMYNNAGILNKVFYEAAMACGGNAWSTIGPLWHQLINQLSPEPDFDEFGTILKEISYESAYQEEIGEALSRVGFV